MSWAAPTFTSEQTVLKLSSSARSWLGVACQSAGKIGSFRSRLPGKSAIFKRLSRLSHVYIPNGDFPASCVKICQITRGWNEKKL